MVNPLREPGLDHYWVPSNVESALFGTQMTDEFFAVSTGGDLAFLNGVLKVLLAEGGIDREFVREHTVGFDELLDLLESESFADLERQSGASRADMERFARMYAGATTAVLVWSMGITQHERGFRQRRRHHQSRARARQRRPARRGPDADPRALRRAGRRRDGRLRHRLPGGVDVTPASAAALSETYGFAIGERAGLTAAEMIEGARRGDLDVLYSSGGNFLEVLPDPELVDALAECHCACTKTS